MALDRRVLLDYVALGLTLVLAAATLYAGSAPVPGSYNFLFLGTGWFLACGLWAGSLLARTHDQVVRVVAWVLIVGSIVSVMTFGFPFFLLGPLARPLTFLLIAGVAAALLAVAMYRADARQRLWYAAPIVVLATIAIVASGLLADVRFASSEPALTAYAEQLRTGAVQLDEYSDEPITVGSVVVQGARVEPERVLLITTYVGILGDDAAGLAYAPGGVADGRGIYEHLSGPWYRWYPY